MERLIARLTKKISCKQKLLLKLAVVCAPMCHTMAGRRLKTPNVECLAFAFAEAQRKSHHQSRLAERR